MNSIISKMSKIYSIEEFNQLINKCLKSSLTEKYKLQGELTNIRRNGNHTYFSLKDNNSMMNMVCWNNSMTEYENGENIIVSGKIMMFIKNGTNQINVSSIEKVGVSKLREKYDRMRKKFIELGFFDRKRQISERIKTVGILTSCDGAALQDILYVLKNNNFNGKVIIKNCFVQGKKCPDSIRDGVRYFNKLNKKEPIDTLIITRGGGSFEDLMGFSSKKVIKTIHKSKLITISAVGHEIDNMLTDEVCDIRAPTPSIAGELITKNTNNFNKKVYDNFNDVKLLKNEIRNKIENKILLLQKLFERVSNINLEDILNKFTRHINNNLEWSKENIITHLNYKKIYLENLASRVKNIIYVEKDPVIMSENDIVIKSKKQYEECIENGIKLKIIFYDGNVKLKQVANK